MRLPSLISLAGAILVLATAGPALRAESERNPVRDPTYTPGSLFSITPLPRQRVAPAQPRADRPRASAVRSGNELAPVVIRPKVDPTTFVVVFGDVLADLVGTGLDESFADLTSTVVSRQTRPDSGLVRSDFHDWPRTAREFLASDRKISIAVIMLGSNDRQPIREGEVTHEPLSDRWRELYRDRIDALLRVFAEKQVPVVWLGNPPMQNARLNNDVVVLNELARQRVERAGGHFVDLWVGFVDAENRFTAMGPDLNGQITRLRANDGVHFTRAGARKAAHFLDAALRRVLPDLGSGPLLAAPAPLPMAPGAELAPLPVELQPGGVERLIDQMARIGTGLEPIAPPVIQVKPIAGPVLPLTGTPVARGATLLQGASATRAGPFGEDLERVFSEGRMPSAPAGRADDFRWPRPN